MSGRIYSSRHEGLFGNQVGEELDLRIRIFLSSYSLVVPFASSEHTKSSISLPGKLVTGNKLKNEGLNVAHWPLGYSWWIPRHTLQSRENLGCSLVHCNLHFVFVLCTLNQVCINVSIIKNEQHRVLSFLERLIQGQLILMCVISCNRNYSNQNKIIYKTE